MDLVESLPKTSGVSFIFMNSYFTFVPLFARLCERGYGACETAQPNSEDVPPKLVKLRKDHSRSLPWGTVNAVVVDNVLCLAWQDKNTVLALSTTAFIV